jgi:hypothetical protein
MVDDRIPANVTKWLLIAIGALSLIIGFIALLIDFLDNYHINDVGNSIALLIGAAILLGTSAYYHLLRVRETRHMELHRRYFIGKPRDDLQGINHNLAEAAQDVILDIEATVHLYGQCTWKYLSAAECLDRVNEGMKHRERMEDDLSRFRKYADEFEGYLLKK